MGYCIEYLMMALLLSYDNLMFCVFVSLKCCNNCTVKYTEQYSDHTCKPVYHAPLPSHQMYHKVCVLLLPPRPSSNNLGQKMMQIT